MRNQDLPSLEELREMSQVDIRNVDEAELVDIDSVTINTDQTVSDRVKDYIRKIGNPYCYISHGTVIKISFTGKKSLEDCLKSCVSMEG